MIIHPATRQGLSAEGQHVVEYNHAVSLHVADYLPGHHHHSACADSVHQQMQQRQQDYVLKYLPHYLLAAGFPFGKHEFSAVLVFILQITEKERFSV